LEVLDVFVGKLDIALAVSGSQHMLAGMAIDDDVGLHRARIVNRHPTEGLGRNVGPRHLCSARGYLYPYPPIFICPASSAPSGTSCGGQDLLPGLLKSGSTRPRSRE